MNPFQQLLQYGQSYWLDNLTREMLDSGELERRVRNQGLRGVTSNPSTFAKSLTSGTLYDDDIRRLAEAGDTPVTIQRKLMVDDVTRACDVLRPVFDESKGADGFVSIEVDPRLARQAEPTLEAARVLWSEVDRPNCMVKIPGTKEGLAAIDAALSEGISVNITLLFSPKRYEQVVTACHAALEKREAKDLPLETVHSVASFFLSRIDVHIDKLLEKHDGADALRGQVALALARRVYAMFRDSLEQADWWRFAEAGARPQRPLWASTGQKNSDYSETMYVDSLVARQTVNTLPEKTIDAFRDSGTIEEDAILHKPRDPDEVLDELSKLGIDIEEVAGRLEEEGIQKFIEPHQQALDAIQEIITEHRKEVSPAAGG
ncbi:MAG: transaldolase [Verrucomicrobiae bacterium]|nr:transaldolase [Verrucomicrobiae bacterium]